MHDQDHDHPHAPPPDTDGPLTYSQRLEIAVRELLVCKGVISNDDVRRTLKELGYENVEFRVADGSNGWPEAAPFDAILVAAAPEVVPRPLLEQLAPGGRLVIPVGRDPDHQELQLWRKIPGTELSIARS